MTNQIKSYLTEQTRECKFETPVEIYYSQLTLKKIRTYFLIKV